MTLRQDLPVSPDWPAQSLVYSVAYGIVNYANNLNDIGYLANTVIYQDSALASNERPASAEIVKKMLKE